MSKTHKQFADEWIEAWNAHDLPTILSHYAEDIVFVSQFVSTIMGDESCTILGKSALREYFSAGLDAYPDLHFLLYGVLSGPDSIVVHYRSVTKDVDAAEYMRFNGDGLIVEARAHYSNG